MVSALLLGFLQSGRKQGLRGSEDERAVVPTLKVTKRGGLRILANSRLGLQDVKPPVRWLVVGTTTSFLQTAHPMVHKNKDGGVVLSPFTNEKIVLRIAFDPLLEWSSAMSGCLCSFVFVLSLLVHALFLEGEWRGWDDDDLLCKIGRALRANGDAALFACPCFSSASNLPLVPEPNQLRV